MFNIFYLHTLIYRFGGYKPIKIRFKGVINKKKTLPNKQDFYILFYNFNLSDKNHQVRTNYQNHTDFFNDIHTQNVCVQNVLACIRNRKLFKYVFAAFILA